MNTFSIATELLEQDIIVCSWGITDIVISDQNITFSVNGFKYKGKVEITPLIDTISVNFLDIQKVIITHPSCIVKAIDEEVENTSLYSLAVWNTLK